MRRQILGAFLLCAACGGGMKSADPGAVNQDPSAIEQRAARTAVELSADARAAVVAYEKTYGVEAVESCLQQWVEGDGSPDLIVYKPDITFFNRFLAACLGVPGNVRDQNGDSLRSPQTAPLRAPETGSMRIPETGSMRIPETGSMRIPETGSMRVPETGSFRAPETGSVRTQVESARASLDASMRAARPSAGDR